MVWVCLIVSIAGGISIVVHQAFTERKSAYLTLGLSILVMGNLIVLSLPIMRGYFLYASSDTIAHVNWTDTVLSSGHFHEGNRYPIIHILAAQVAQICGLSSNLVIEFLPLLFSILFTGCSYLLAGVVLPTKSQAMLAGAGATTLFFGYFHVAAYPQGLSMMALPLIFYFYFRRSANHSLSFRLLFVILLLFFPFFHPATALVLIVCLAGVEVAKTAWRLRVQGSLIFRKSFKITAEPTLISLITFFTWVSAFGFFGAAIQNTLLWLRGEIEMVPRVTEIQNLFASQGLGTLQQMELALKLYGDNFIYLVLTLVALFIIIKGFLIREEKIENLFVLLIPFLISGPVWVLIFIATLQITLGRLLGSNAMMWTVPVLVGFALQRVLEKAKRLRVIIAASVLFCASLVAILGVYHSPLVLQPSWQIVLTDVYGTDWFLTHYDSESPFATLGVPPAYALSKMYIQDHFLYQEQSVLGASFTRNIYLLLTERFKIANSHPVLSRAMISDARLVRPGFTRKDFDQLERDPSVNKFYTNGEFDTFLIRSMR